ncbi:expressed unknown protein [Seminavis robusta]|uniref:Uncharacterized protein n=1 Tax=Seminavis robusta TaxID=568900 RepID=A0A9N8HR50_9STRA|nr:expressed unknown protein [Seminavis robusta]|eukprot:Sro1227_g254290.1 n/a (321) ;mRNA; r:13221-14183
MSAYDLSRAQKILQNARKLAPARPEADFHLAACFQLSGHFHESSAYLMVALKLHALAALAWTDRSHFAVWADCISEVVKRFLQDDQGAEKPDWWCDDGKLKRIIRVAHNELLADDHGGYDPSALSLLSDIHGLLLGGHLTQGKQTTSKNNSTNAELTEASKVLLRASKKCADSSNMLFFGTCKTVQAGAQKEEIVAPVGSTEKPQSGEWMLIDGLTGPAGLVAMNHKLALVAQDGLRDGRVVVEVDGFKGLKCIRPEHLDKFAVAEEAVAFISCLDKAEQWRVARYFARDVLEELSTDEHFIMNTIKCATCRTTDLSVIP